jgi:DnaJ-class molecular chaperone
MTCYYKTLGITRSASLSEIKAAYKKLVLQYHPDKTNNEEWAKSQFLKIQEAYDTLSSEDKRRKYDSEDHHAAVFNAICIILNRLANKWQETQPTTAKNTDRERPPDLNLTIDVDLEDVYANVIKAVKVKVLRQNVMQSISLAIPMSDFKDDCIFEGQGDNKLSDIIVTVNMKTHDRVHGDSICRTYDLFMDLSVTLYEYYYATHKPFEFLCGEQLEVDVRNSNKRCVIIRGKGLPFTKDDMIVRGDLYVFLKLKLPENTVNTQDTEQFLLQYFNDGGIEATCI